MKMRRLKLFKDENAKRRKVLADLSLDRETLQNVLRRRPWDLLARTSWSTRLGGNGMS